jgi:hypothetical protein
MSKKLILMSLLLASSFATLAKDNQNTTMQFGNSEIKNSEFQNLHHSGNLELDKVNVKGSLIINGHLEAKDSKFNDVTINGDSELKQISFQGPVNVNGQMEVENGQFAKEVQINGHLEAKDSTFKKPLTISTTKIELKKCEMHDIHIQKSGHAKQKLELKETHVKGNIHFDSNEGVVELDAKSKIDGKVTGAKVEKD